MFIQYRHYIVNDQGKQNNIHVIYIERKTAPTNSKSCYILKHHWAITFCSISFDIFLHINKSSHVYILNTRLIVKKCPNKNSRKK